MVKIQNSNNHFSKKRFEYNGDSETYTMRNDALKQIQTCEEATCDIKNILRQCSKVLRQISNNIKAVKDKIMSDIEPILEDNHKIKDCKFYVHKCILAFRCKQFEYSIESNECSEINLECDPNLFRHVLGQIQSGNIYLSQDQKQTLDLICVSEKLMMDDLKILCEEGLAGCISVDNILDCLVSTQSISTTNILKKELYNTFLRDFDKICNYHGKDYVEDQVLSKKGLFQDLFFFASGKTLRDKKKVSFVNQEPMVIEDAQDSNDINNPLRPRVNFIQDTHQDTDSVVNSENFEMEVLTEHTALSESESNQNQD